MKNIEIKENFLEQSRIFEEMISARIRRMKYSIDVYQGEPFAIFNDFMIGEYRNLLFALALKFKEVRNQERKKEQRYHVYDPIYSFDHHVANAIQWYEITLHGVLNGKK